MRFVGGDDFNFSLIHLVRKRRFQGQRMSYPRIFFPGSEAHIRESVQFNTNTLWVIAQNGSLDGGSRPCKLPKVAEDIGRFMSARHLTSWAGLCPVKQRVGT